jgi:hypothetical protein
VSDAYEKGRGLEGAVLSIESTILQASPGLAKSSFRIETRKIVTVSGVRHEFDLWVEVDPAPGYAALFVFECKNWSDKVGKNEIIVFSEKVKAVQAQRGFFVAREFTRDAQAQAALDPRIQLLEVKEEVFEDLLMPLRIHVLAVDNQEAEISLREAGVTDAGDTTKRIDFTSASAVLDGQPLDLSAYLMEWRDEVVGERTSRFPSQTLPADVYPLDGQGVRTFARGTFQLNGAEIESATLKMKFTAEVIRPAIVSSVQVVGRGRVWHLAPVTLGGGVMHGSLITLGDGQVELMAREA